MFTQQSDNDAVFPTRRIPGCFRSMTKKLGGPNEVKVVPCGGHEISPAFFECPSSYGFCPNSTKVATRPPCASPSTTK